MDEAPQRLDDGEYDVLILDCENFADGTARTGIVVVGGPFKGAVVTVVGPIPKRADDDRESSADQAEAFDETSVLGLPGRLRVTDGRPHLEIDD